ncbi:hypothetical protein BD626DRAFT_509504 [Schizophyllum amplum]|uniref:Uncharacterized protein n=1 Tax=Schizophyllum amplum TaxID=97359 RepID=A0A550C2K9_9AGAR|nr:hypothetical protein BD626DRAFT_509504 [Auriculariopsis ampla]
MASKHTKSRADSAAETLSALSVLGAPDISNADFERLYRGPLGTLLDSIASHMKGRKETALIRATIQMRQAADARPGKRSTHDKPSDNLRRATSRLNSAQKSVEVYEDELHARQISLAKSSACKRSSGYLLESMAVLEEERGRRLRKATDSCDALRSRTPPTDIIVAPPKPQLLRRRNHTELTLHNLHAYHVHLHNLTKTTSQAASAPSARFESILPPAPNNDRVLASIAALHEDVSNKEGRLQRLSDISLTRLVVCQKLAAVTTDFAIAAAPSLSTSLHAQITSALGRVECLREDLGSGLQLNANDVVQSEKFANAVKALLKIHGHVTSSVILEECIMGGSAMICANCATSSVPDLEVSAYESSATAHEARAIKLLSRKSEKADYGIRIIDDMEQGLLRDMRIAGVLHGHSGGSGKA